MLDGCWEKGEEEKKVNAYQAKALLAFVEEVNAIQREYRAYHREALPDTCAMEPADLIRTWYIYRDAVSAEKAARQPRIITRNKKPMEKANDDSGNKYEYGNCVGCFKREPHPGALPHVCPTKMELAGVIDPCNCCAECETECSLEI